MLGIPWTVHARNEQVLKIIGTTKKTATKCQKETDKNVGAHEERRFEEMNTHREKEKERNNE